jgi:hypothetical protein
MAARIPSGLVLDAQPSAVLPTASLTLVQHSAIGQAVGVLIGTGHIRIRPAARSRVGALAGRVERHVAARVIPSTALSVGITPRCSVGDVEYLNQFRMMRAVRRPHREL